MKATIGSYKFIKNIVSFLTLTLGDIKISIRHELLVTSPLGAERTYIFSFCSFPRSTPSCNDSKKTWNDWVRNCYRPSSAHSTKKRRHISFWAPSGKELSRNLSNWLIDNYFKNPNLRFFSNSSSHTCTSSPTIHTSSLQLEQANPSGHC